MVASLFPLRLSAAVVRRRKTRLIGPVDLEIGAEGFTIVMGPNGAGKTTLLRTMHGLERLAEGSRAWAVPEAEARRRQAFVFQRPVMLRRTVLDNVAYPLTVHGMPWRAARGAAGGWLDRVGLAQAAERRASDLSGGERQKLALARALIRAPSILFLDEPCASLDGRAIKDIEAILRVARADGVRIVMSTHDHGQARRLAEEVLFLHNGVIHEAAPASAFFDAPQTPAAAAFLRGDIVE